eukprot:468034_1
MAYQRVEIAVDSDDESPLLPLTINYKPKKIKKKNKKTFLQWMCRNCWSKGPFFLFVTAILGVFFIATLHFFVADVSFIMCGLFLALDIYALRHFYRLLGLKRIADKFAKLHRRFKNEKDKLFQTDKLQMYSSYLHETCDRLENANQKRYLSFRQLKELQTKLQGVNMNKIAGITSIRNRLNQIQKGWSDKIIYFELNFLRTLFDRMESYAGDEVSRQEYEQYILQLHAVYRTKLLILPPFEVISNGTDSLKFSDIQGTLNDIFSTLDAAQYIQLFSEKTAENHDQHDIEIVTNNKSHIINKFGENERMIQKIMKIHEEKINRIELQIDEIKRKNLSLHRYNTKDVSNTIEYFVCKDINYRKYLKQTIQTLSKNGLSEEPIINLHLDTVKAILETKFLQFMQKKTFQIIFDQFSKWINQQKDKYAQIEKERTKDIRTKEEALARLAILQQKHIYDNKYKNSAEIAYMIYNYPLDNLLNRINDVHDAINGIKFIEYYVKQEPWMENVTGWNEKEIAQVQSVLFKCHSGTKSAIIKKINDVCTERFDPSLSKIIIDNICEFDVEELQFKIKNCQNIQNFSDVVMNMIDELLSNDHHDDII